ncbi:alpha/beta hydrolase [Natrialba taiwanensis]|uniref:Hydrolase of the alpha/beta superfamily-like protein n=1 Tax=Natrialba taiwanensis DSM 12281 TaxID=1230458 RepID=L9ZWI9_9EURY|nr:CocE/NonD family hydrolase [Natrialba taiwanensis]ELY89957.1 hydrolase of the alpha/beta superfamily-like protein [Natrialba taiwanensis DSM 12281]
MTDVLVPGGRDVRATLTEPDAETDAIVVACPPHPQQGGSRSDSRLVAVADRLRENGVACLRFDYGEWDEGYGEREDVRNAIRWATERYDRVGLFGYSFGASLSLLTAADVDPAPDAVAVLAPAARLADDLDAAAALRSLPSETPVRILYGERDTTVDWEPVVERARERGDEVTALPADHFFLGKREAIAEAAAGFFEGELLESGSQ